MHIGDYTGPACASGTIVTGSITSQVIAASDPNRLGMFLYNHGNNALFLKLGHSGSISDFSVKIASGSLYELPRPIHTGSITGVNDAAGGTIMVTTLYRR